MNRLRVGRPAAKAVGSNFFVGQERRLGDQNRLDTDVVLAVNGAFQRTSLQGCLSTVTGCSFGTLVFRLLAGVKTNENPFFRCPFSYKKGHGPLIPNG